VELSLPVDERSCHGREFIASRRIELDRLIEQSPNIPLHIVKLFGKKFANSEFIKPDILEITGVEVYKDDIKEKESKKRKELELKKLEIKLEKERKENEETIIKKIREEESKRHTDFKKKLKEKLQEATENNVLNRRLRAKEKKKNIGFSSISKSMSSLIRRIEGANDNNEIITPDSSDMDDSPRKGTTDNQVDPEIINNNIIIDISENTII